MGIFLQLLSGDGYFMSLTPTHNYNEGVAVINTGELTATSAQVSAFKKASKLKISKDILYILRQVNNFV